MLTAGVAFLVSLLGVMGLFGLKYWELRHDRVLLPRLRSSADARASQLKELMVAARMDLSKLPPAGVTFARIVVHRVALALAFLARMSERQAHKLADLVSYKHRFEARETRSEFLKKVAEHKNGTNADLDVANDNGHNV